MMWNLSDGLELVRRLQPLAKRHEYHIALGGGVLNRGESNKDIDLYVLGFNSGELQATKGIVSMLFSELGEGVPISAKEDNYPNDPRYRLKLKYNLNGRRIDVFIQ